MKFMDFQNNDDIALDEYNILKENNWKSEDLQRIMEYYTEVKESKLNNAILVDLKSFG
jgi:hypothetical protein